MFPICIFYNFMLFNETSILAYSMLPNVQLLYWGDWKMIEMCMKIKLINTNQKRLRMLPISTEFFLAFWITKCLINVIRCQCMFSFPLNGLCPRPIILFYILIIIRWTPLNKQQRTRQYKDRQKVSHCYHFSLVIQGCQEISPILKIEWRVKCKGVLPCIPIKIQCVTKNYIFTWKISEWLKIVTRNACEKCI